MLLQEFLKHTLPAHPDHDNLQKALDLITSIANHVNETLRFVI